MLNTGIDTSRSTQRVPLQPLGGGEVGEPAADGYDFQFVEVGEPSQGRYAESRSAIRMHAMRGNYNKRK
jgi:hypothetical protein